MNKISLNKLPSVQQSPQNYFHLGAIGSLVALIVLCVAWEMVLAPLHPGGSLLALKAVPLLIPLRGVITRDVYTLQWTSMVILLYFTEGVVRGYSDKDPVSSWLAWGEAALVGIYFVCAVLYLRPYKKAAKKLAKELLDKVNPAK
jgi:uncharacterized membrane protein